MKTKLPLVAAFFLIAFAHRAHAQFPPTDYSVLKVSASLPGQYQNPATQTLVNFTLTTKAIINIALGNDITAAVPPNVILGFAGDFDAFAHNTPDPNAPAQLVVFDTDTGEKKKTVGVFSNRVVAENKIINRFKRVAFTTLAVQDTIGTADGRFISGSLAVVGSGGRRPNVAVATPANVTITATATVIGAVQFFYTKNDVTSPTLTLLVRKGSFRANGKVVGTFTE